MFTRSLGMTTHLVHEVQVGAGVHQKFDCYKITWILLEVTHDVVLM